MANIRRTDAPARECNGAAVRAIREALGIKQSTFATDCGMSAGYLSNIEAGRKQPSPTVLRAMADRLSVTVDAISAPSRVVAA